MTVSIFNSAVKIVCIGALGFTRILRVGRAEGVLEIPLPQMISCGLAFNPTYALSPLSCIKF